MRPNAGAGWGAAAAAGGGGPGPATKRKFKPVRFGQTHFTFSLTSVAPMLRASLLSRRLAPHARALSTGSNAKLVVPIIDFAGMYGTEKEQLGAWISCPFVIQWKLHPMPVRLSGGPVPYL
jgi:hypothetical protein